MLSTVRACSPPHGRRAARPHREREARRPGPFDRPGTIATRQLATARRVDRVRSRLASRACHEPRPSARFPQALRPWPAWRRFRPSAFGRSLRRSFSRVPAQRSTRWEWRRQHVHRSREKSFGIQRWPDQETVQPDTLAVSRLGHVRRHVHIPRAAQFGAASPPRADVRFTVVASREHRDNIAGRRSTGQAIGWDVSQSLWRRIRDRTAITWPWRTAGTTLRRPQHLFGAQIEREWRACREIGLTRPWGGLPPAWGRPDSRTLFA
jgi:hypothetical protein